MKYAWVKDAEIYVDPQVAGEVIESIKAKGDVTPDLLIEDSRPDSAPLHSCFEWDDEAAAVEYRREQARTIIRSIRVVSGKGKSQVARSVRVASVNPLKGKPHKLYGVIDESNVGRVVANGLDSLIKIRERFAEIDGLEEAVACLIDVENAIDDYQQSERLRKRRRVA